MSFEPGRLYHVFNQGNNRQQLFFARNDYLTFLTLYNRLFKDICSTIAWCLMPNHFHFQLYADERCNVRIKQGGNYLDPITNSIRKLLSGYTRIYNSIHQRTGSMFRQKTKAKCLSDIKITASNPYKTSDYYVNCFHYIHQNPMVANLVTRLEDWEFSSFQDYAGLRKGTLCQKELAALHCGYTPDDFIEKSYEMVDKKIIERFT